MSLSEMGGDLTYYDDDDDIDDALSSSSLSDSDGACQQQAGDSQRAKQLQESQQQLKALLQKASAVTEHLNSQVLTDASSSSGEVDFFLRPGEANQKLLPHQVYGVKWLLSLFRNGQNGILADEMGLGKTVQICAFLSALFGYRVFGTHLIVVPLSTLDNWRSEITRWLPWCPLIVYHGDKAERASMRTWLKQRRQWCLKHAASLVARNAKKEPVESLVKDIGGIVITSYEMTMMDHASLGNGIPWDVLVVDEAHRLKNFDCKLIRTLRKFQTEARVLLSGTPLQNNVGELWSILNFIVPWMFSDMHQFKAWFAEVSEQQAAQSVLEDLQQAAAVDDDGEAPPGEERRRKKKLRKEVEHNKTTAKTHEEQKAAPPSALASSKVDDLGAVLAPVLPIGAKDAVAGIVKDCHAVLRPFLLRRTKLQIPELAIPPKYEVVLYCPLFSEQERLYNLVKADSKYGLGRMMHLRKVCAHPFIFREFDTTLDAVRKNGGSTTWATTADGGSCPNAKAAAKKNEEYLSALLSAGAKLSMLHRMLPHLHKQGHRVLLFSQMTKMLDVVEDYIEKMASVRGVAYTYVRLDGSSSLLERKDSINKFTKQHGASAGDGVDEQSVKHEETLNGDMKTKKDVDEGVFLFLISTRSGGIGLNLVAADTVILLDCDFNPQNDLQAVDRCHRIGQTKPVVVYRLISPHTIEEAMMKLSLRKLRLEKIVIGCGGFSGPNLCSVGAAEKLLLDSDAVAAAAATAASDEALLQTLTMNMTFGDTSRYVVGDEDLAKLMNRAAVSAECEAAKKKPEL